MACSQLNHSQIQTTASQSASPKRKIVKSRSKHLKSEIENFDTTPTRQGKTARPYYVMLIYTLYITYYNNMQTEIITKQTIDTKNLKAFFNTIYATNPKVIFQQRDQKLTSRLLDKDHASLIEIEIDTPTITESKTYQIDLGNWIYDDKPSTIISRIKGIKTKHCNIEYANKSEAYTEYSQVLNDETNDYETQETTKYRTIEILKINDIEIPIDLDIDQDIQKSYNTPINVNFTHTTSIPTKQLLEYCKDIVVVNDTMTIDNGTIASIESPDFTNRGEIIECTIDAPEMKLAKATYDADRLIKTLRNIQTQIKVLEIHNKENGPIQIQGMNDSIYLKYYLAPRTEI